MNVPIMIMITAAITAERVMPAGLRVARVTGAFALVTGAIMCLSAIGGRGFLLAIDPFPFPSIAPTHTRGIQSEHRPALPLHRRAAP